MNNREAVERFDQTHNTRVENLYWIAGAMSNDGLKDLLEEMDDEDYKTCFPEIYNSKHFKEYRKDYEVMQALIDFNKFGFIAEIHIPNCDNFTFEKGKPVMWSIHEGHCRVGYVYAETTEELLKAIEKAADKIFKENVAKERNKAALPTTHEDVNTEPK